MEKCHHRSSGHILPYYCTACTDYWAKASIWQPCNLNRLRFVPPRYRDPVGDVACGNHRERISHNSMGEDTVVGRSRTTTTTHCGRGLVTFPPASVSTGGGAALSCVVLLHESPIDFCCRLLHGWLLHRNVLMWPQGGGVSPLHKA
jgi:hypothetical protein